MITGKRNGNSNFWWAVHNIIAHPLSELLYCCRMKKLSAWVHDESIPMHDTTKSGRG